MNSEKKSTFYGFVSHNCQLYMYSCVVSVVYKCVIILKLFELCVYTIKTTIWWIQNRYINLHPKLGVVTTWCNLQTYLVIATIPVWKPSCKMSSCAYSGLWVGILHACRVFSSNFFHCCKFYQIEVLVQFS